MRPGTLRPGTAREHLGTLCTSWTLVRVPGRVSRPGRRRCIPERPRRLGRPVFFLGLSRSMALSVALSRSMYM
eukprot:6225176-Prymnesium_polylepis.2